jgi:CubicO group peptidase (beta-lactamase class C family)
MMLFEEGYFLLDDPIADFLPEFTHTKVFARETADGVEVADLERPITIRHLLMHAAGLTYDWPDFFPHPVARMYVEAQTGRRDETLADKVSRLATLPLVHQPGAGWTYGHATELLGRLIEVITGRPLDSFLRQRIFEPLEMSDTDFHVPPERYERLARVYVTDERGGLKYEEGVNSDFSASPIFQSPGGGLVSTAEDYARFLSDASQRRQPGQRANPGAQDGRDDDHQSHWREPTVPH